MAEPPTRNFRSNPINRLNYEHEQFKLKIDEIAFTSPSSYFKMKKEYLSSLVKDTIVGIHTTIFNALTEGSDIRGRPIFQYTELPVELQGGEQKAIQPRIPDEEADQIAMNVAKTLKDIFSKEVIDKIFKTENISQALERASRNAELKAT